jgi:hypothetical protein
MRAGNVGGDRHAALQGPVDPAGEATAQGDGLIKRESAIQLKAMAQAALNRPLEAWLTAESGRSLLLRTKLRAMPPSWEELRAWLGRERAGVLALASNRWGTLVMSVGPDEDEPVVFLQRSFGGELQRLLRPRLRADSAEWTNCIFSAVGALSSGLIAPFRDRLRHITANTRILYIIPNDLMFYAPFAALEIEPGLALGEVIPFSIVPSLSVLLADKGGAPPGVTPRCLAVAAGKDLTGADFAPHLRLVASAPWPEPPAELSGEVPTAQAIAAAAPGYDILYVSCHGRVDDAVRDAAKASCLDLAGGTTLTASDVAAWPRVPGLVFLNACQAGRFRASGRSELGGLPGAFISGGSRAIIAPLTHVDPNAAGIIAEAFFRFWFAGHSPAEALRAARLELKARGRPPEEWAAHTMFGSDLR